MRRGTPARAAGPRKTPIAGETGLVLSPGDQIVAPICADGVARTGDSRKREKRCRNAARVDLPCMRRRAAFVVAVAFGLVRVTWRPLQLRRRYRPAAGWNGLAERVAAAGPEHRLALRGPVRAGDGHGDDLHHPGPVRLVGEHRPQRALGLIARAVELDHLIDETVCQCPQHWSPLRYPSLSVRTREPVKSPHSRDFAFRAAI